MTKPRYLTKSRYKLGLECPTKLFYTGKNEYFDNKMDDAFLEALAQGGFQVGELAKLYYPGGHDLTTLDSEEAESQTQALLKQENVIIYEPAIRYKNLFIRIDILVKKGNKVQLIEVKAKSFDPKKESPFFGKSGGLSSEWSPYLHDVAFQNYVLCHAYPDFTVDNYLMMANKNTKCATTGLNQKFRIIKDDKNRKGVRVSHTITDNDLAHKVLVDISVNKEVDFIQNNKSEDSASFEQHIHYLAGEYEKGNRIESAVSSKCKKCEFTCSIEDEQSGKKNGFKECWKRSLSWTDTDFKDPHVFDIWNFKSTDKLFEQGKYKIKDIEEEDLNIKESDEPGLTQSQRQWLQIEKSQNDDTSVYLDVDGMKEEMDSWIYPLHFIDFETTTVAIPFTQGRRPYEQTAFQFSHHVYHKNGKIEHIDQYLNTTRGEFPNVDFIRALKRSLENDNGTIFRFATHENTILNTIHKQIKQSNEKISDADELCKFIESITYLKEKNKIVREGERNMVDMCALVKKYYFEPATKGSNSIKAVLPAVLNSSEFIKEKYSKPIYGTDAGIKSHNFSNYTWIVEEAGKVKDPYKLLPKMFQDASDKYYELLSETDELNNGGAALTAYAKIQFEEMSDYERKELENGLLMYCELDTFAMVMIYEAWRDLCC